MAKKVLHVPQHKAVSSTPATPDLGFSKIYAKSDGYWYRLDELGNEVQFADSATVPDLQAVTFAGNTTTYDINLDGSDLVLINGGFSTTLTTSPTHNNILTLPDATGTLLYGSGTPGAIPVFSTIHGLGDSYLSQTVSSVILDQTKAFDVTSGGTLNIGTANASIINIGWSGVTVNIKGNTLYEQVTELLVEDSLFTINKGGGAGSASSSGFEIEEAGNPTGYFKTGTSRNSWRIKPPATNEVELLFTALTADRAYTLPNANGTIALTSDLGSYVPTTRTISTTSPLSGGGNLSSNLTLSIAQSSGSANGYLSSTDWTTFNGKQDALVSGVNIKTIVTKSIVGSGNVTIDINDLSDVDTASTPPTNGQTLVWNKTTSLWVPGTITSGIQSLNGLTPTTQTFATGTSGTDFNISSATSTHTFNLPDASASTRGALTTTDWTTFNSKVSTTRSISTTSPLTGGGNLGSDLTLAITQSSGSANGYLSSTDWTTFNSKQDALTLTTTGTTGAATLIGATLNIPNYTTTFPQASTIYVDSQYGANVTGRGGLSNPYLTIEYALSDTTNTGTFTCNTATSTTLSGISDAANASLEVGQFITGSGIQYATIIVAKGNQGGNANTVTLSKATDTTATGITATWWKQYRLVANGKFNVVTSLNKSGFIYDFKNAIIYYGAISLFRFTANSVIPEYFFLGKTYGTSTSSLLFNHTVSFNSVELDYGYAYSAGTGVQIGNYLILGNAITISNYKIYGEYLNAQFGTVAKITGNSSTNPSSFDGNTYGFLGGLSLSGVVLNGTHVTPAGVTVYSGSNLSGTGYLKGAVSFGGVCSFKGSIDSTAIFIGSFCSIDIAVLNWAGSITTTGTKNTLTLNTFEYGGSIIVNAGASLNLHGMLSAASVTVTGTLNNFAQIVATAYSGMSITVNGTFINNGVIAPGPGVATYFYVGANGLLKNNSLIQTNHFTSSGTGYRVENNSEIEVTGYGILLVHSGIFNNNASIITRGTITNASGVVTLGAVGAEFNNRGLVYNKQPDTGVSTISKTSGILRLYPGSVLKVSNGKGPIQCTANTSASKDIYMLHCITNCDGSTYGLGFAFDGSSFVPNDLAGGLKYENTAY